MPTKKTTRAKKSTKPTKTTKKIQKKFPSQTFFLVDSVNETSRRDNAPSGEDLADLMRANSRDYEIITPSTIEDLPPVLSEIVDPVGKQEFVLYECTIKKLGVYEMESKHTISPKD